MVMVKWTPIMALQLASYVHVYTVVLHGDGTERFLMCFSVLGFFKLRCD